jgi:hypothetical protein
VATALHLAVAPKSLGGTSLRLRPYEPMAVQAAPAITTSVTVSGLLGGGLGLRKARSRGRWARRLQLEGMSDEHRRPSSEAESSAVERLLRERTADLPGVGKPLTERARIAQRSVEAYLTGANNPPRWMERVAEIDRRLRRERRLLAAERRALRARLQRDDEGFAGAWRAFATERGRSREYRELNELIRAHNEWYPVERNLPVNPRTGEWVTVGGRSFPRPTVGAEWILRELPADDQ